jgi:hypothetical protein
MKQKQGLHLNTIQINIDIFWQMFENIKQKDTLLQREQFLNNVQFCFVVQRGSWEAQDCNKFHTPQTSFCHTGNKGTSNLQ